MLESYQILLRIYRRAFSFCSLKIEERPSKVMKKKKAVHVIEYSTRDCQMVKQRTQSSHKI